MHSRFHIHSRIVVPFCLVATVFLLLFGNPPSASAGQAKDKKIDASDPTKIYTFVGIGPKYTEYTNNESMVEARISGNIGLKNDMIFFNGGYGKHSGDRVPGSDTGFTDARIRWFHLFKMDYSITSGYRGWATQIDSVFAGELKGTDGQNVLSLGGLPAFGLNKRWSLYLPVNIVNSFDKKYENYNGMGLNFSPLLVYVPGNWWNGAYVQLWPGYTRFFTNALKGEGAGNIDVTVGGKITPTITWSLLTKLNFDKDLRSYRRDEESGLRNDWNIFLNITTYF